MAAVPAALKSADIARFAQRAGQLEKAKPVVAYWCMKSYAFLVENETESSARQLLDS